MRPTLETWPTQSYTEGVAQAGAGRTVPYVAIMPQSLSAIYVHAIFSTKDRHPFLRDAEARDSMHRYLAGVSNRLECPALHVGGVEDHVHILARISRTLSLAEWIKELKRASSLQAKEHGPDLEAFAWQSGYGVFSVSPSNIESVRTYIDNQAEHHRNATFQDEFRAFLRRHNLEWDERYVWD